MYLMAELLVKTILDDRRREAERYRLTPRRRPPNLRGGVWS